MGLNVRIYNIVSDGIFEIRYKSGDSPYPTYDDTTFILKGTFVNGTTTVTIEDLEFDTHYWIKMTDVTTGRHIVKNIHTNDSKTFPCYDTMCFDAVVECDDVQVDPSPTPTNTPTNTPDSTPTNTPTTTPTNTPTITPTPSNVNITRYYTVRRVLNGCIQEGSYYTFVLYDPSTLSNGNTGTNIPVVGDYINKPNGGFYVGCWVITDTTSGPAVTSFDNGYGPFDNCTYCFD